jgi:hypothetical protein
MVQLKTVQLLFQFHSKIHKHRQEYCIINDSVTAPGAPGELRGAGGSNCGTHPPSSQNEPSWGIHSHLLLIAEGRKLLLLCV